MAGEPRFSIIVPTLDRPGDLRRCLASLAALDYPQEERETIVVDDGGSQPLDPEDEGLGEPAGVRVHSQPNAGPAAARNAGAAMARGEILVFVDDDLVVEPGWLAALEASARSSPGAVIGGRTENGLPDNPCAEASARIVRLTYEDYNGAGPARFFASNNLAVPAAGFRELGGFDPAFRVSEDRDFCDRWLRAGRELTFSPAAVARHRKDLTLGGFLRQHCSYGRGAFGYHRARAMRGGGDGGFEGRYYRRVAAEVGRMLTRGSWDQAALLVLWQLANLVGFVAAAVAVPLGWPRA